MRGTKASSCPVFVSFFLFFVQSFRVRTWAHFSIDRWPVIEPFVFISWPNSEIFYKIQLPSCTLRGGRTKRCSSDTLVRGYSFTQEIIEQTLN